MLWVDFSDNQHLCVIVIFAFQTFCNLFSSIFTPWVLLRKCVYGVKKTKQYEYDKHAVIGEDFLQVKGWHLV